jgi:hypothetical protein
MEPGPDDFLPLTGGGLSQKELGERKASVEESDGEEDGSVSSTDSDGRTPSPSEDETDNSGEGSFSSSSSSFSGGPSAHGAGVAEILKRMDAHSSNGDCVPAELYFELIEAFDEITRSGEGANPEGPVRIGLSASALQDALDRLDTAVQTLGMPNHVRPLIHRGGKGLLPEDQPLPLPSLYTQVAEVESDDE